MFYLIKKSKGESSFQAIRNFARNNGIRKVGHSGTLDPLATGLLLVATNEDTKLLRYIDNKTKKYIVSGYFGAEYDTYDIEGEIISSTDQKVSQEKFLEKLDELAKLKTQVPPIFSAKKINGIKAYDLARAGKSVELKPQNIEVYFYKVLEFSFEKQFFKIEFHVSEGTYIRSLVHDLGKMCDNYAYMSDLERHKIGDQEMWEDHQLYSEIAWDKIIKMNKLPVEQCDMVRLQNGNEFKIEQKDGLCAVVNKDNEVLSVVEIKNSVAYPKNVFHSRLNKEK
ncbi:tRNA pseudouridine(55) synthase TruB [Mycoplasma sp. Ms02]|uniref:tRNA pseudouridine(55) synthase TruB n=1 Tax=Mycoplasma sp. Ms02 TaxID=353851 RepID=UPI001C8A96F1|nr:tRNA pseudouridine(55) synthase TruB [Mycoplasma sp. Ms02]QZE12093.1 tRNA pseudouridine(55) synthase TruB [Mycoplasma sp. Ms02]